MSDRSDEVTRTRDREPEPNPDRDAPATDDLLEETDRLLSETGAGTDPGTGGSTEPGDASAASSTAPSSAGGDSLLGSSAGAGSEFEPDSGTERDDSDSSGSTVRSLLSPLASRLSLGRYFSPKAYFALVLLVGVGLLVGATALPFAGRMLGMFATAFAVGLVTSKRRYLEMSAAGLSVGGVAAVLNHLVFAVAGAGQAVVAVGATVGLVASVGGYYFGRDLRDGLQRDID
ncbi:hypothetical protein [Natrinema salifodinae]|uniref:DUF456 domain-containing protein n=1 Tax=Natrinema salifodinae TaxID=1202768 RepID=A0A1I0NLU4_9EURY|nr:hypothetical protein [Natrinema salifodinae]SEW02254.1 hypothetical protein SAMN05216285_1874 [Natrinema salifodinae]